MMRTLHSLLRCSAREWLWLAEAAAWLWAVRLGLWLLPFRSVQGIVTCWAVASRQPAALPPSPNSQLPTVERVAWAITVAGRVVPAATCLAQALAAQVLLGRRGCLAQLQIGVARGEHGPIEAHAWLEHAGQIVIGGPRERVARYTVLPTKAGDRA